MVHLVEEQAVTKSNKVVFNIAKAVVIATHWRGYEVVPAVQMLRNFGEDLGYSGCLFVNVTGSCGMKNSRDFRVPVNGYINKCDRGWLEPALGGPAGVGARDGAHQSLVLRHIFQSLSIN
ncbi:MAG: hypothetical protein RRB22_08975 [Gammaproteobacteria bacterium]|nr:hypothetical protein [Gammaproteobacteria bacterium]